MTLDKLKREDFESYCQVVGDASIGVYDSEFPKSGDVAVDAFEETLSEGRCVDLSIGSWRELVIRDDTGTLVGLASYKIQPSTIARVGVHLQASSRGKGLASFALQALLGFLTTNTQVCKVEAFIDPENLPSCKLFERCGFSIVGMSDGDKVYTKEIGR